MILADESFNRIETRTVGDIVPTHGFSSFKFLPGSQAGGYIFYRVGPDIRFPGFSAAA